MGRKKKITAANPQRIYLDKTIYDKKGEYLFSRGEILEVELIDESPNRKKPRNFVFAKRIGSDEDYEKVMKRDFTECPR